MSDISKMSGEFEPPIINENLAIVNGRGPVATFMIILLKLYLLVREQVLLVTYLMDMIYVIILNMY